MVSQFKPEATRRSHAQQQFETAMAQMVATPVAPAPKVVLRQFHFDYYSKSDCTGHADIVAENREQALCALWHLHGDYIQSVWAS